MVSVRYHCLLIVPPVMSLQPETWQWSLSSVTHWNFWNFQSCWSCLSVWCACGNCVVSFWKTELILKQKQERNESLFLSQKAAKLILKNVSSATKWLRARNTFFTLGSTVQVGLNVCFSSMAFPSVQQSRDSTSWVAGHEVTTKCWSSGSLGQQGGHMESS